MLIRPATIADAPDIARLANQLGYPVSDQQIAGRLTRLLGSAAHFIAVAAMPPSLVGWVAAERRLLLESGERVELVGLVVASTARRAGIGRALVQAAEAWAVAQKLRVISVRSNVARAESHPFYERLGYTRTKTQHAYSKQL
ncbi:GNAT family N-acetyltransferase [soil metagenome]